MGVATDGSCMAVLTIINSSVGGGMLTIPYAVYRAVGPSVYAAPYNNPPGLTRLLLPRVS
jgi:hypothetical protein